jgi:ATP-dependent helicase HrpA
LKDRESGVGSRELPSRSGSTRPPAAGTPPTPGSRILAVARLRLPEKLARTLTEDELPVLDRPVRFVVLRGQRGAIRARTLDELQDALDRPWSPDETDDGPAPYRDDGYASRDERAAREVAAEFRRERDRGRGGRGGRQGRRETRGARDARDASDGGERGGQGRGRTGRPERGAQAARRGRRRRGGR